MNLVRIKHFSDPYNENYFLNVDHVERVRILNLNDAEGKEAYQVVFIMHDKIEHRHAMYFDTKEKALFFVRCLSIQDVDQVND